MTASSMNPSMASESPPARPPKLSIGQLRVVDVVPISNARAMFVSTGAEAVENAVKIARAATGRPGVIAFSGGFHGRTNLCMGLTGKVVPYKKGFGPFTPEIYHAPFPAEYLGVTAEISLEALDQLFKSDIQPDQVAARVKRMVIDKKVNAMDGKEIAIEGNSVCVHCDTPGAFEIVKAVRTSLEDAGCDLKSPEL